MTMDTSKHLLTSQYQLILDARSRLFDYLETLDTVDFTRERSQFPLGGSVRNLLVHIANTYEAWIIKRALGRQIEFTPYVAIDRLIKVRTLFDGLNQHIQTFIQRYGDHPLDKINIDVKGTLRQSSPLELFTHVTTHEFQHKGQILTLTRHLGYTPLDTDIIFFP